MKLSKTNYKISALLICVLLIVTLQLNADNSRQAFNPPNRGSTPTNAQIENALRLGNQFQEMAPQQHTPMSGAYVPPTYYFLYHYYGPVVSSFPYPNYPLIPPYYGHSVPYYTQPYFRSPYQYEHR